MELLPPSFAALEGFAERWAVATSAGRAALRNAASLDELRAFHEAVSPSIAAIFAYLDAKAFSAYTAADWRLIDLTHMLAHVALAVEVQGADEPDGRSARDQMQIVCSDADRKGGAVESVGHDAKPSIAKNGHEGE